MRHDEPNHGPGSYGPTVTLATMQVVSPLGDMGGALLSAARDVPDGARAPLFFVPGLFRVDVIPGNDATKVAVRNLLGGTVTVQPPGYASRALLVGDCPEPLPIHPVTMEMGFELQHPARSVRVRVSLMSWRDLDAGTTRFTAQAAVEASHA